VTEGVSVNYCDIFHNWDAPKSDILLAKGEAMPPREGILILLRHEQIGAVGEVAG
jgi:hypothetical protein